MSTSALRALSGQDRHVARRFSGGLTPELARDVDRAGSGRAWFAEQLRPGRIGDRAGDAIDGWFPSLRRTPEQIFDRQVNDVQGAWDVMGDLSRWTVARRIHSRRQLHEQLVDFWSNLLHVPLMDDSAWFFRVDYDRVIRKHALRSFEDLLIRTTVHPAMGLFLDNAVSTKEAPNENLGRELLELHTVGVDGGYTERDVKHSSRMLTGYRVDLWWPKFRAFYDPKAHHTGRIKVLGFVHPNRDADGRRATRAYLRHLAQHPATARRIAHRLCVRFVHDDPSNDLVRTVARAYRRNASAIRPTLEAMVDHPEFAEASRQKIRTPTEDYVATVRALGIELHRPTSEDSFANAMLWQYGELGNAPYEWPAPNGYPEAGAAWTSAGRILSGLDLHRTLAAGWWPTEDARVRSLEEWLPAMPASVGEIIDHVSGLLFGEPPSRGVRAGVATALGLPLEQVVPASQMWSTRTLSIVASLLDSPTHLMR
ncbi:MAG TPA: DUF1800 domain-containing protein [Marmoricola sp.]|nr:DUF1800 domain-containing protein [Marmoricola sp.]